MVEYPSAVAAGPRSGSVFVAVDYLSGLGVESVRPDLIRLVEDVDGDGYAEQATVYASGFNSIQGLAFHDGTLFVMHAPFLSALRDGDGDGVAEDRRDLLSGLGLPPAKNPSRLHCANGVVVGHDGWLYLALGDRGCDVLRPEGDRLVFQGGGILRCRADARDLHVFASGLRNIYDIALDEELNVFVRDNENDGGDYLIRVDHSFFGADHGYPYLYAERPLLALPSLAVLGRGSSAGGLCYQEAGFPAEYRGDLFFCEWGRAVMRYRVQRSGSSFAPVQQIEFAAGGDNDPYGFKPTDLVAQRDGSMIVADWADGQTPKRGRGRLYRIAASGQLAHVRGQGEHAGTDVAAEIARLDSESITERVDAQLRIERRGREALSAVRNAVRRGRIGARGRLHAVWIVAHLGGPPVIDELLEFARSDTDPRVQAQAVRTVADLADPVLTRHRLAAGPGDAELAARIAGLAGGKDPRVVLELTIAVGRLRWPGTPAWLRQTLKTLDPALTHAAMQAMRRSANWPALLALLDEPDTLPTRAIALRAVADRALPEIVDGLIVRLDRERNPERRLQYADTLARVYKQPGPWIYWGFRPAPRPANTVAWERTGAIAEALDRALADSDDSVRSPLLRRMVREKVATRLATLNRSLRGHPAPETVAAVLQALRDQPAVQRRDLLATVISDRLNAAADRLEALALWSVGSDQTADSRLLGLAGALEDGPVLAAALRQIKKGSVPEATPLLIRKLSSPVPNVREAAVEVAAALHVAGVEDRVRELLEDRDRNVRRTAAAAVGTLGLRTAADRLIDIARDPDPGVRSACLLSLCRLRDSRAVPLAVTALADRETQLPALACLAELGGPIQGEAVADLAKRSPTAEILPYSLRILTTWSRDPSLAPAQRRALDRVVADVQGATGLLARWEISALLPPEVAVSLVPRTGMAGQPFAPPAGNTGAWQTLFAAGALGRLKLQSDEVSNAATVRLGYTDFTLTAPATLQFLGSSNGKLRVWADSRLIHQRSESQPFQPDSDRFQTDLDKGSHRLTLELASASSPAEFHLRFRRTSSNLEQEQLIQTALTSAGDPKRGRKVLDDVEKSLCLKCHRVGDRGERIGPDLSGIGGRFSRITIIEAILDPSRGIAPGFDSVTVALADGRVLSGVRVAETERTLTIGDQEGRAHTIAKGDVEALTRQPRSTMPDGLEKRLMADDFVDLIAYLASEK